MGVRTAPRIMGFVRDRSQLATAQRSHRSNCTSLLAFLTSTSIPETRDKVFRMDTVRIRRPRIGRLQLLLCLHLLFHKPCHAPSKGLLTSSACPWPHSCKAWSKCCCMSQHGGGHIIINVSHTSQNITLVVSTITRLPVEPLSCPRPKEISMCKNARVS